jgi:glycosyltransferase involved in cell wall biosynthesis
MMLTTIIPTHDRPTILEDCLATLIGQEIAPEELEVVVVDDGSQSDIRALVTRIAARSDIAVRCERQSLSGLNAARNRGVAHARGKVLAFLDDDTLVSPGWARAMAHAFESYPCAAVGGRVDLGLAAPAPSWLPEFRCYLAEYDLGSEARWLDELDPVPVGANCAVRRSEFDRIGGFLPGLDRIGGSLVSNGDTEFFRRLRAAGKGLRYEPAASVTHRVQAERLTVRYFMRRNRDQGASDEMLLRLDGHAPSLGHKVGLARELMRTGRRLGGDILFRPPVRPTDEGVART